MKLNRLSGQSKLYSFLQSSNRAMGFGRSSCPPVNFVKESTTTWIFCQIARKNICDIISHKYFWLSSQRAKISLPPISTTTVQLISSMILSASSLCLGKVKSNNDQRQSPLNTIKFGPNTWISLQEWLQITLSFHTGIQWSQCLATEAYISKFTTITHAPTGLPHFIRLERRVQNDKMLPVYSLDCLCRQYFGNYPEIIFHDWINYSVLGVTSAWILWKTLLVALNLGLMFHRT